ncbi:hypothetical protein E4T39_01050 [Aureobasidium subglaciale]|nr:hypothetical protein E4T39_01050 [Aureobasidium subglaciale]
MTYEPPEGTVLPTNTFASDLAEISGIRDQILANGFALFPDRTTIEVIVMSAEFPETGWYGARLVDISDRHLLLGRQFAQAVPEALGQLLQETCDAIRDSYLLQNYRSLYPSLT